MENRVKLDLSWTDSPFRIKMTGGRTIMIALSLFMMATSMCSVGYHLAESNELRRQQLDEAKRQYTLDSLRFEYEKALQKQK